MAAANLALQTGQPLDRPGMLSEGASPDAPGGTLAAVERDLIKKALADAGGNVTEAARALGISRDTLRYRIEKYRLRESA